MSSMFFIIICLLTFILQSSGNFHCINVASGYSSTGDDNKASISCPSSYTMTSCGFYGKSGIHRDGGYIDGSKCYAQNARHGTGVKAMARCCQIPGGITCIDKSAKVSGDDNRVAIKCPNDYHIFGCTASCPWSDFDGSFFNTNDEVNMGPYYYTPAYRHKLDDYNEFSAVCQAQSSELETTGHARCCKSSQEYPITCKLRYGPRGTTSSVGCSGGYTMIGCAAWTYWDGQNRWYIDDDNNCIAHSGDSSDVWASASCCKIDTTSSAMSIGFSRSDDSKLTAITLNATSIFLVLIILVIISLLCCIYYQTKTILAGPTTEIDESTADEIQKLKAYQI